MTTADHRSPRHIMRLAETERMCGFKRSHIYNLVKEGRFPSPRRIGARAIGWDSLEIERWVADRLEDKA